jgi:predicted amidohydrolase
VNEISTIRVAAAQYRLEPLHSLQELGAKLARWIEEAAAANARLLVFPEYAGMEMASLADQRQNPDRRSPDRHTLGPLPVAGPDRRGSPCLEWETDVLQPLLPAFLALHSELAARYRVYILAGSLPVRDPDGSLRNTAYFFTPDGLVCSQDKIVLTRWEREVWRMTGGDELRVFDTEWGPIGCAICYDVEFPMIARQQAEARARIILAPCCTDSLRGYYRVRVGARARALENQAYVIQSPLVGDGLRSSAVARNVGFAAVYAPPDLGPRENGVVTQGPLNETQWVYADLDLKAIDRIRRAGSIANADEWAHHARIGPAVKGKFRSLV